MSRWAYLALAALLAPGCTSLQLQRSTVSQATTLSDIQYQQVLDNLALMAHDPGALPFFALANLGQIQITDTGSTTDVLIPNAFHPGVWSGNYGLTASRSVQQNWTVTPVTDPDKLKRMRCAYQLALGVQPCDCDKCLPALRKFFCSEECRPKKDSSPKPGKPSGPHGPGEDPRESEPARPADCERCLACAIPQGWFAVGGRKDVPKDACYVGHSCDTFVWVLPGGVDALTRFTLSILDLASAASHEDTAEVRRLYDSKGRLTGAEVTTTEAQPVDPLVPGQAAPKARPSALFVNPIVPSVPRP